MSQPAARRCLCGCGRQLRRTRSMPLCYAGTARVNALIRDLPLPTKSTLADPVLARRNYVWSDPLTVQALLAGDLAEVIRRNRCRELGFHPDRLVVGA